jgi:uncharacterized protein (TIGR00255 family)
MTGYGVSEKSGYRVEIRSLNHRFLDINIKSPGYLNEHEIIFRNTVRERFSRGKFDISITVSEEVCPEIKINTEYAKQLYSAFVKLKEDVQIPGDIDISSVLSFRDMFLQKGISYDFPLLKEVFRAALEDLYAMRVREGNALVEELNRLSDSVVSINEKIRLQSGKVFSETLAKFNERIKALVEGKDVDSSRILQEAAIFAGKLDISEEVVRIESHLVQFREILSKGDGGIIGRKLDFILQELNREVNTISSKSANYTVANHTVEMKTDIEKMREQVQNIQ